MLRGAGIEIARSWLNDVKDLFQFTSENLT